MVLPVRRWNNLGADSFSTGDATGASVETDQSHMMAREGLATTRRDRWWELACGLVTILLGALAAFLPDLEWISRAGLIGWLLLLAGIAELGFGLARRTDPVGVTLMVSGFVTALAGLIFVADPASAYLRVANIVTLWLMVRGIWLISRAIWAHVAHARLWLGLSAGTDIVLAIVLLAGIPVSLIVVGLFGPTPAIVARFSLIFATSFVVTGISQIAIARMPGPGGGWISNPG